MHYPMATLRYGPLVKTLRFESKNGVLKETVHLSKNKKNIPYTMAKRHQMRMYLFYKKESITDRRKPYFVNASEVPLAELPHYERDCLLKCGISFENLHFVTWAKAVVAKGHRYGEHKAVLLGCSKEEYVFGLIEKVMHIRNKVYIITRSMECIYNEHYHAYQITRIYHEFTMTYLDDLYDHHPLGVYHVDEMLLLTLRYFVSDTTDGEH